MLIPDDHAQNPSRMSVTHILLQKMWNHGIVHFPIYAARQLRSLSHYYALMPLT